MKCRHTTKQKHDAIEKMACRELADLPIVSIEALLTLTRWIGQHCKQGGELCTAKDSDQFPPARRSQNDAVVEPAVGRNPDRHKEQDASDAQSNRRTATTVDISNEQGGDA